MIRATLFSGALSVLCMIAGAGHACFQTPDSRPLVGCMPFNFSAPLDWAGYKEDGATLYPEVACYKQASRLHTRLIERLVGQMRSGEAPDAFGPSTNAPDLNAEGSYNPDFDFNAVQHVKKFTPPFVREYYPPLYAIAREFEACMGKVSQAGCGDNANCRMVGFTVMGYLPDGNQYPVVGLPDFDDELCSPDMRVFLGEEVCSTLEAGDIEGVLELKSEAHDEISMPARIEIPVSPILLAQPAFWERVYERAFEILSEQADRFDLRHDAVAYLATGWSEVAMRRFPAVNPDIYRATAASIGAALDLGPGHLDPTQAAEVSQAFLQLIYGELLGVYVDKALVGRFMAQNSLRLALTNGGVVVVGTAATFAAGSALGILAVAIEEILEENLASTLPPEVIAHELGLMGQFCAGGKVQAPDGMFVAISDGRVVSHVSQAVCTAGYIDSVPLGTNPLCNSSGCMVRILNVPTAGSFSTAGQEYTTRIATPLGAAFSRASIEQASAYTQLNQNANAAREKRQMLMDFIEETGMPLLP